MPESENFLLMLNGHLILLSDEINDITVVEFLFL